MKNSSNYPLAIIGGIIGGLIASIPWILLYVYANFIVSFLAVPIAMGVSLGYQKLGGPANKALPTIITVKSLIIVAFVATVIIPLLLLHNEGFDASFHNLRLIYEYDEFFWAIMRDLAISLIFVFIGIRGVITKLKQEAGLIDDSTNSDTKEEQERTK